MDLSSSETMIIMIGKFWKGLASQAIYRYTWKALWSPHPLSANPIVVFIWLIKSPHVASLANHQETCLPALILFCGRWKEREECTGEIIRVSMTELWGHLGEGGLNISRSKRPPPPNSTASQHHQSFIFHTEAFGIRLCLNEGWRWSQPTWFCHFWVIDMNWASLASEWNSDSENSPKFCLPSSTHCYSARYLQDSFQGLSVHLRDLHATGPGSSWVQFLVSAGFYLYWPSAVLDLGTPPLVVGEMSPSSQTHLTENGATAELIGAPRDAGEMGILDRAGLGDKVGGLWPGVPLLHLVHLLDLPSHLVVFIPGAVTWFYPSNHLVH